MVIAGDTAGRALLRRGFALEYATLGWNVARHRGAGHRGHLSPVGGAGRRPRDGSLSVLRVAEPQCAQAAL